MLLKDMKAASAGDLKLAVSVIYMTLEVSAVMTDHFIKLQSLKLEMY